MKRTTVILVMAAALLLGACDVSNTTTGNGNQPETAGDKKTNTNSRTDSAAGNAPKVAGPCENKYFPVSDGLVSRFKVSDGAKIEGESVYTQMYKSGENKFSTDQKLNVGGVANVKVDWLCTPEGLQNATYGELSGPKQVGMVLDTTGVTGVTIPKDTEWAVGKKWTTSYDLSGTFDMKVVKGPVSGKVILNHEITSLNEKVAVPAGEFNAAKVQTTISMDINFQGRKLPAQKLTTSNWYAEGVGLVKQSVDGTLGKSTMDYLGK